MFNVNYVPELKESIHEAVRSLDKLRKVEEMICGEDNPIARALFYQKYGIPYADFEQMYQQTEAIRLNLETNDNLNNSMPMWMALGHDAFYRRTMHNRDTNSQEVWVKLQHFAYHLDFRVIHASIDFNDMYPKDPDEFITKYANKKIPDDAVATFDYEFYLPRFGHNSKAALSLKEWKDGKISQHNFFYTLKAFIAHKFGDAIHYKC